MAGVHLRADHARDRPGAVHLVTPQWLTTMSVMDVTMREFTRKLPDYRRAALAGKEVRVRDRSGQSFVFRAVRAEEPVSLADAMGDLIGSVKSGRTKKALVGCGRS